MKICKFFRILTLPQLMAFALMTILYFADNSYFRSLTHYVLGIMFLTVLPLLAYPIAWIIKKKADRRSTERTTAIILSILGYIAGAVMAFFFNGTDTEKIMFLTYLLSVILTALLSFAFKFKSSGHACGIAGPIAMLTYKLSPLCLIGCAVLAIVYVCSLKLKRHTLLQLIAGTFVPVLSLIISIAVVI